MEITIYAVHSDIDENSIRADFITREEAIDYARGTDNGVSDQTWVEAVSMICNDFGECDEVIDQEIIWSYQDDLIADDEIHPEDKSITVADTDADILEALLRDDLNYEDEAKADDLFVAHDNLTQIDYDDDDNIEIEEDDEDDYDIPQSPIKPIDDTTPLLEKEPDNFDNLEGEDYVNAVVDNMVAEWDKIGSDENVSLDNIAESADVPEQDGPVKQAEQKDEFDFDSVVNDIFSSWQ